MDATTKERMNHAAEVLQWLADEKPVQWHGAYGWRDSNIAHVNVFENIVKYGAKYRLKPAKTRRPFIDQEARRLVGCVLVSPDNKRSVCYGITENSVRRSMYRDATLSIMEIESWHYHLPGDPDNLKPCWVEE